MIVSTKRSRYRLMSLALVASAAALILAAPMPAHAATNLRPITIAVFGDSTDWGQGVKTADKYATLFGHDLGTRTGRPVQVVYYAHSGAPLAYAHAGYDGGVIPQGWGSCSVGFSTPGEIPVPTPSIVDCQLPQAAASGRSFDLAILNGCGVDVGVLPTTTDYRSTTNLFTGAAPVAQSVDGLCSAGLASAVRAAHTLPGAPKVILNGSIPPISRLSVPDAVRKVPHLGMLTGTVTDRFAQYDAAYITLAQRTVAKVDPGGSWAAFQPTSGTARNALFAPDSAMWNGFDDQLFLSRARQCKPYNTDLPTCAFTSIAHPNLKGQQIMRNDLNSSAAIKTWFSAHQSGSIAG